MSVVSNIILLGVVVAVGAAALVVAKARLGSQASHSLRFKAKPLLTANEFEFLARLETALPELRICPQVAMGALLDPAAPRSDGRAYYRARAMFSQKIVDFVALDRTTASVVAIIELDDRTHSGQRDAQRDAMLAGAGYKTIRWSSKTKPDAAAIRAELLGSRPQALARSP